MEKSIKKIYIRVINSKTLDQVEERSLSTMLAVAPLASMDGYGVVVTRSIVSDAIYKREKAILRFIMRYRFDE